MSGYVPNNRNERPAPTPAPYNGDFHRQAPRPLEGGSTQTSSCLVGLRFVWDNGECLGANLPYSLSPASGNAVRGSLDSRGGLIQTIPSGEYQAQLLADADVDTDISNARAELQAVLDEILAAERAEAAQLQAIQDQRSAFSNYLHRQLAVGNGFFLGAWGLLKTAKEFSDLVNPFTAFSNALRSAWQARASEGETWLTAYNRQFSAEQHRELVEALGFDPSSITREQLAEAYELACFIYEDGPSKAMLGRFAVDYAKAQNVEEVAEFSGGALFEIVLAALLIVFTGGIGLAARGAASVSYLDKLARLGNAFRRLGAALKRARIRRGGRATGSGTGARTVEVERPRDVLPGTLAPMDGSDIRGSPRKGRNKPPEPLPEAEGRPHSIIERPGRDGQYTTHNGDGTWKQYRGSGQDHGGIPRPNVKEAGKNTTPDGREIIDKGRVRPARPDEIPRG
ncbi:polymorphic toxin type 24 domain-containing protein [Pseudomonas chengduensis]|nr:polymorphic toxin type 24 domain-containing protein [Pseudomonas chengduensis]MDH1728680.1 polymorphic toxin type 24 domain-containing protein [Pseudomonas chengduensis]